MKSFTLVSCSVLVGAQYGAEWEAWKSRHGRKYASLDEETFRHKVFAQNMINAQEAQVANPFATFGSDEFSDWAEDEERTNLFGAIPEDVDASIPQAKLNMTVQIPSSKDWTGTATTPVKKQKCGSCWANSAMEQIESDFMLQKGAKFILSPQEAVDCNGDKSFRNGCKGGWPDGAYQSGMQLGGFELEADYPDQGKDSQTKQPIDKTCLYKQKKAVVTLEGFQNVGKGSETEMQQHVGSTGPLSVCLLAAWKGYKSGILSGCPSNQGTNHCVQIVGYGTDGGKAYWKVRNSWGPSWGEQGHIRLAFGSNQCNINSHPTSTTAGKILKNGGTVVV
jgi:C1A family cysteine protease